MRRAVSLIEVAEPAMWDELQALGALEGHVGEVLGPTTRVALPSFERDVVPELARRGHPVLLRWARRDPAEAVAEEHALAAQIAALPSWVRRVLHAGQRHAIDGEVLGLHAWDPESDASSVRQLRGAELIEELPSELPPYLGPYRLHPDLPPPPPVVFDAGEAVMPPTDDLGPPAPGPVGLLHDLAALAAAIEDVVPRRVHAGTVGRNDARRLAAHLGDPGLAAAGDLETHPRWGRALRGLEALRVVSMAPLERTLHLDLGLERTLAGDTPDAVDHLVHKMIEPDLHAVVPVIREALRQAGDEALDEVVLLDLIREQYRDVIFPPWRRDGVQVYPHVGNQPLRRWDDDGFEAVETRMIGALFGKLARLGLIRRSPGVLTATADGRAWSRVTVTTPPPVWVSGDLEVMVPPHAITPWERFQLERLGRCLARDVVDRYRLERRGLTRWLATHEVGEALDLLRRRCPGVPQGVEETLRAWAASANRIVLVRGVVIEEHSEDA